MRIHLGLVLIGIASAACSQPGNEPSDLGNGPNDSSAVDGPVGAGQTLSLIAGGLGGPGNVDDTGAAARWNSPEGVAADGAGNLYVADTNNCTIRKVVISTGVTTTIAGTAGMPGSVDGTGAAARFYYPRAVATDGAGNVYVADTERQIIRKVVVSTGVVTTLAGTAGMSGSADGTGAAARFNYPYGVVADSAGNLYVADSNNNNIRKVEVSTGVVTTLAGTAGMFGSADGTGAAARFLSPQGVALDGAGNLYVADNTNYNIRKVVVSTGVVTTLAGSAGMLGSTDGTGAAARFNFPRGLALDGAGNLYVGDTFNHTVRKVVASSGVVTTLVGSAGMSGSTDGTGAAARFNAPRGVSSDGAGNLYIADAWNSALRQVAVATGATTTLASSAGMIGSADGTGAAARFDYPIGVAADGVGNLYVSDGDNSTLRQVVIATGVVTTLAGTASMNGGADGVGAAARFSLPQGVVLDGAGNLYVADSGGATLRKVVISTGAVTTIAGTAGMVGNTDGTGAAARFRFPVGVALDGAGNLYVADSTNHTLRKVVLATGVVTTLAGIAGMTGNADGTGVAARFNQPKGLALDSAGNLYVDDTYNHTIRKVVVSTGVVTTLAGTAGMPGSADGTGAAARFNFPAGVALDNAGNLYIADNGNATVRKLVINNGAVTTIVGVPGQRGVKPGPLPARLNGPTGVTVAPSGELIIADGNENAVLIVR